MLLVYVISIVLSLLYIHPKSVNNIKSRNIFSSVKSKVKDGSENKKKVIDIEVDEKPTGEISAGAGTGTYGSTLSFGLKEINYLGKVI